MPLTDPIIIVLQEFETDFSRPTWCKVQVLLVGTLFARGRCTVTAALRQMGLHEATNFRLYHHVLSRARGSALEVSRRLLHLLVRTFVTMGGRVRLVFSLDSEAGMMSRNVLASSWVDPVELTTWERISGEVQKHCRSSGPSRPARESNAPICSSGKCCGSQWKDARLRARRSVSANRNK
jgi:hypothetical protein